MLYFSILFLRSGFFSILFVVFAPDLCCASELIIIFFCYIFINFLFWNNSHKKVESKIQKPTKTNEARITSSSGTSYTQRHRHRHLGFRFAHNSKLWKFIDINTPNRNGSKYEGVSIQKNSYSITCCLTISQLQEIANTLHNFFNQI